MSVVISGDAATTRTNLGYGTAATLTTGTSANQVVVLDGSAKLPAVDGSNLTSVSGGIATTPAFGVYSMTNTTISEEANIEMTSWTEDFDTDGCFASGRFTPTTAGTYFVTASFKIDESANNLRNSQPALRKNGSYEFSKAYFNTYPRDCAIWSLNLIGVITLNGSSDYVSLFINVDTADNGGAVINARSFFAYRIA